MNAPALPHASMARPASSVGVVVGRSFSFRFAAQVLSAIANIAGMAMLGNTLAAAGYGTYAFYYSLIPLIASVTDLGIGAIVTRQVARDRSAAALVLGDALTVKAIVGATLLTGVLVAAPLTLDPARAFLVILVTATAVIDFSQDVGVWFFRANDRQDLEARLLLLSQLVWLTGIALCSALHAPLTGFLAAATVAFALRAATGLMILSRGFHTPVFSFDLARLRRLVAEGLPYGLAMFTAVCYGRLGVLMLTGMATASEVAFYNVGYLLSQPLGFVSSAFNVSIFPSLARAIGRGDEAVRPLLRRAVKFQFLAGLPLAVGLFILAPRIVPLLLKGEDFRAAGTALQVISAGLVLIFLNLMARHVLTALDSQRAYFRAIVGGLVANAAVSAALIGRFGAAGACAGLLAGELTVLIVSQRALRRWMPGGDLIRELIRPLAAAAIMGAVVFALREAPLFLVPVVGAAVYAAAVLGVRALSAEELRVLRDVYISFRLPGSGRLIRMRNGS